MEKQYEMAADEVDAAARQHKLAGFNHAASRTCVERMAALVKSARTSVAAGNSADAIMAHISDLDVQSKFLQATHAKTCTFHDQVSDSLARAQQWLSRGGIDANATGHVGDHDPIANPTAAQGAQTSDGPRPRSMEPETRGKQDSQNAHAIRKQELARLQRQTDIAELSS
jgi:hypothetical protein